MASAIYESMDELGRLMVSINRMNVDNVSPIFGVEDAKELGFEECIEEAAVRLFVCAPTTLVTARAQHELTRVYCNVYFRDQR